MFEHFSARAIEVIALARSEARRLEFGTFDSAHVLLGLAAEGRGIAADALKAVGFDVRKGRGAAERRWGRGYEAASDVTPTEEVARLVEAASAIAEQTVPLVVDTQDLLRAILGQPGCRGTELLAEAGIATDDLLRTLLTLREQVLAGEAFRPSTEPQRHFHPRLLAPAARKVLDRALEMTREFGHGLVGTEQLLVGLVEVEDGAASEILRRNGIDRVDIEAIAHRVIGRGSGSGPAPSNSRWVDEALERAWRLARNDLQDQIGTCHLLLGLLELDAGGALLLMDLLGINLAAIQLDVEQFLADQGHAAVAR